MGDLWQQRKFWLAQLSDLESIYILQQFYQSANCMRDQRLAFSAVAAAALPAAPCSLRSDIFQPNACGP